MPTDSIREHLRHALNAVVSAEKNRLHAVYDKFDDEHVERVKKLAPIFGALRVLADEISETPGAEIGLAAHGHMATISLNSSASWNSLSLSTSPGNKAFTLEMNQVFVFSGENSKDYREFLEGDAVLAVIVEEVGKFVAQQAVLLERKK